MIRFAWLPLVALAATPVHADPGAPDRITAALGVPSPTAPGCAVGIFRDGKTTELANAGAANIATGRAIGSDTQFYAASVSKQFTAVALMQLVVAGKVKLTDDVRKYIPELADYGTVVTVQMLLNMTGGIRDSLALLALEGKLKISEPSRAEALAGVLRQKETNFTPGTQYDYTNGGYLLLSEIIERVSKQPFETYVNANVLKPLGMTRSFMMLGKRTADANATHGYIAAADGKVTSADEYPLFGGSGGLITTVNDLAKWDRDIDNGHKVWTPEITRLMVTPGQFTNGAPVVRSGRGIAYGNGLIIGPHWFHHTGGAAGYKTLYGRLPEKRMGIALLCNNGAVDPAKKADEVIAALNEGLPAITEPSSDGSALNGRYRNPNIAATYVVDAKGDTINLTLETATGGKTGPLALKRNGEGAFKSGPFSITPDDDARGFTLDTSRISLHFVRAD
ncbi:MAG: serine hydrolase domain-containing protein [Sphingobium sp.]